MSSSTKLSLHQVAEILSTNKYVATSDIETAVYLALNLEKPLLVEGEPGCGKTELAKVLASGLGTSLIRLQCYEGLDANHALYEWDYLRQLLKIKIDESKRSAEEIEAGVYSDKYLLRRPLLEALLADGPITPVLLIDELDRADEEFEGFLLEFLAEYQVTIPEYGTVKAKRKPITILTSNRTRELGDGLKRRCLYLYLSYPSLEKELEILMMKVPDIGERLANQIVSFTYHVRRFDDIAKKPGVAETLDWASALLLLEKETLDTKTLEQTVSCIIKGNDDIEKLRGRKIDELIG